MVSKLFHFFSDKSYRRSVLSCKGIIKIDDREYISELYFRKFGVMPRLDNPITFNEKIQWLKLHDRNPKYTELVDKYEVKAIVGSIIGEEHIIPTLGVWDKFDEIDFEKLPNQFVLKCTHDSGGLYICRDKSHFDYKKAREKINKSLKTNFYLQGREWPYKGVKPRIIAEAYMEEVGSDGQALRERGLTDYKFFCFNNEPHLLYISRGLENHPTAEISFYDMNGQEMPFHRNDYKPFHNAKMPDCFDEMKVLAKKLSSYVGSPFVRIDLYSINGTVYFSEITFSPCSGMIPFEPATADVQLGSLLELPAETTEYK